MLNIVELERKWLQYKIKSFIPYALLTTAFITSIVGYYFYQNYQTNSKNFTKPIVENKKKVDLNKSILSVSEVQIGGKTIDTNNSSLLAKEEKIELPQTKTEVVKLDPSMDFINNFKPLEPNTKRELLAKETIKKELSAKKPTKHTFVSHENLPSKITIKKQDTAKDLENVLKRFQKDKNPALSLFLAKKYYELGDYKNASNYALVTNKMNKDIEDSWLIFTKSLVKLNQKEKAVEILTKYVNSSKSNNAAVLLNEIQSGAFQWNL